MTTAWVSTTFTQSSHWLCRLPCGCGPQSWIAWRVVERYGYYHIIECGQCLATTKMSDGFLWWATSSPKTE